jgi:hypothetical protein
MVINREKSQSKHSNHVIEKSATTGIVVAGISLYNYYRGELSLLRVSSINRSILMLPVIITNTFLRDKINWWIIDPAPGHFISRRLI